MKYTLDKWLNKGNDRNSSIELLRIISMIGVVILHYNNEEIGCALKYVTEGSLNQYYLYLTGNIFIGAVDLFFIISAYYLASTNQRKLTKIVELIVQVIVFKCAIYLSESIIGFRSFTVKGFLGCLLPINYFVIQYSVVYILSPYFNILIDKLEKKQFKKLMIILLLIFSVWTILVDFLANAAHTPLNGLSTVGLYGSQNGYSIVNFSMIYFVGAYLRKNNVKLSSKKALCSIIIIFAMMYISSILEHLIGFSNISTWNYNNPLIILVDSLILLLFLNIQYQNKLINELAKGAFTCFLFHKPFMTHLGIENMVNQNIFFLVVHQFGVAIVLYIVSYVVFKIYHLCSRWFIKLLTPLCNKIDISM